jgi:hypothetical protein
VNLPRPGLLKSKLFRELVEPLALDTAPIEDPFYLACSGFINK